VEARTPWDRERRQGWAAPVPFDQQSLVALHGLSADRMQRRVQGSQSLLCLFLGRSICTDRSVGCTHILREEGECTGLNALDKELQFGGKISVMDNCRVGL